MVETLPSIYTTKMKHKVTIRFLYDVQCPYAYVASQRVQQLAAACNANVEYFPVLLGGLYEGTKAPQGKDGSASDVMAAQKQKAQADDLHLAAERWNVKLKWNAKHPIKSVNAQRLLAGTKEQDRRAKLTHALFSLYWQQNEDVSDVKLLYKVAASVAGMSTSEIEKALSDKETLRANTAWAVDRGVFGVPAFFVIEDGKMDSRFIYGGDRTFLLGERLGLPRTSQPFGAPLRLFPTKRSHRK